MKLCRRLYDSGYQAGYRAGGAVNMPFIITALANHAADIYRVRRRVKTKTGRACWAFYEDELSPQREVVECPKS